MPRSHSNCQQMLIMHKEQLSSSVHRLAEVLKRCWRAKVCIPHGLLRHHCRTPASHRT